MSLPGRTRISKCEKTFLKQDVLLRGTSDRRNKLFIAFYLQFLSAEILKLHTNFRLTQMVYKCIE